MASQRLTTFKNNDSMWWVNVRLFLSAPSIKQPLCKSFYSLPTSSGGVTSTLVLHPLDLIKIWFQGKMLPITWLCVTCKCIAMLNVMLYATSGSTKTRNPETESWKRKRNGNGDGIRNLWKKVPSDRFEKKNYVSNDNKINKHIKKRHKWIN